MNPNCRPFGRTREASGPGARGPTAMVLIAAMFLAGASPPALALATGTTDSALASTSTAQAAAGRDQAPVRAAADTLHRRIDRIFAAWDRPDSPGCALGVMRDGRLIYSRGYGSANLDHEVPITPRTAFYIASTSKQFTAAAIALLALDGRLSLDDDVRAHIPELPGYGVTITISDLVHHTSGLRDYLTLMGLAGRSTADLFSHADVVTLLARQRDLNFEPGTDHLYSNSGYVLMAEIVERVSGKSLRAFTDERIFRPLGMHRTRFLDDHREVVQDRAVGYGGEAGAFRVAHLFNFDGVGDGGLYTTIEDFVAWDRNFDDPRVGNPAFLELILRRGRLSNGQELSYAFGLTHGEHRRLRTVGHGGSFMGFRADYVRFPDQGLAVAAFCNLGGINPGRLTRQVASLYLGDAIAVAEARAGTDESRQATAEREPDTTAERASPGRVTPAPQPAEAAGEYYSVELDAVYVIERDGDRASLLRPTGARTQLQPEDGDRLRAGSQTLRLVRDANGRVTGFILDAGRVRNLRFERRGDAAR